jgi:predicted MFS family arabinose efflux permease
VVPAFIAVALLMVYVREPEREPVHASVGTPLTLVDARQLPMRYWLIVLLGGVFTLARFSEAFLILRAQDVGMAAGHVPVVMIVMNVAYAAGAYPAGRAADRISARTLLLLGLALLIVADLVLALAATPLVALAGSILWGLHMAFTQGLLSKLVADNAPQRLRGTAFGLFNLVGGIAILLASVIAGALWSAFGATATFVAGAVFAALTAFGLLGYREPSAAGGGDGTR